MESMFSSTIAAVSTPRGKGGVAVIRISGDDAISICSKFLVSKSELGSEPRKAILCKIVNEEKEVLDEGLVTVFKAPHSYTGEDTVEISCHGSEILCREILELAFRFGAIQAGPGEFTRRAFSAGKLSLTEAESVIGMIDATSKMALKLSRKNLDGKLSQEIEKVYQKVRSVVGSVYAGIDFPDEDLATLDEYGMYDGIEEAKSMLDGLKKSYKTGHAVCEGISTVLCGKPNTGKSTILNLLYGDQRAIVTDIAGTTRDVISETVVCGDVTLNLHDTAGIRESSDSIEKIGVDRSFDEVRKSELILAVFDSSRDFDDEDREVLELISECEQNGACVVCVINKTDLAQKLNINEIEDKFKNIVKISANDDKSKYVLVDIINKLVVDGEIIDSNDAVVTNARQYASICRAYDLCNSAIVALKELGPDIAGSELERAMVELSQLDGREVGIDIVNDIFHKFCVGK
ncbi:MAG: tRNA uridine-5-carboxymethylaminomethyl(34) synthesis GTPase MnmE [Clostridia bacterium]|nr:tRNA uridine-5-carboxymethylaminomethyl(34) synthesis GTPase MnmE [Clostridia bacterium]